MDVNPATIALLITRGCDDADIDHAYEWLASRRIPTTTAELLAQVDEAIAIARSLRDDTPP